MAPSPPIGKQGALARIRARQLPVLLGSPHPTVMILEQDGMFRIRGLVIDPAEAEASRQQAMARRQSWLPEDLYVLGKPTGEVHLEATSQEEFLSQVQTMDWPRHW